MDGEQLIDDIDFQILAKADFVVNIFEESLEKEQTWIIKGKYLKSSRGSFYRKYVY